MMPVIRISDDNFRRLQEWAVPLQDTVDTALGKVLDAATRQRDVSTREVLPPTVPSRPVRPERPGLSMNDAAFYPLILVELEGLGGRGTKAEVTRRIGDGLGERLSSADWEIVATGESRWANRVAWARNYLRETGYLRSSSPRGVWELTDAGTALAKSKQWPRGWIAP